MRLKKRLRLRLLASPKEGDLPRGQGEVGTGMEMSGQERKGQL